MGKIYKACVLTLFTHKFLKTWYDNYTELIIIIKIMKNNINNNNNSNNNNKNKKEQRGLTVSITIKAK